MLTFSLGVGSTTHALFWYGYATCEKGDTEQNAKPLKISL